MRRKITALDRRSLVLTLPVRVRARKRDTRCYELAGKGIAADGAEGWELVHGTTDVPVLGTIGHAWLQLGKTVYDPVLGDVFEEHEFTALYNAVAIARYSRRTACLAIGTINWGPWSEAELAGLPDGCRSRP